MGHLIERMIERSDGSHQIQRLTHGKNFARLALRRNIAGKNLAIITQRLHCCKLQHILGTPHLITRLAHAQA